MEDNQTRTLQGQRRRVATGGKRSAIEANGVVRPQDWVRQVKSCKTAKRGRARGSHLC